MTGSPRIAIVDDDVSVRRALVRLCKSAGYEVVSFEAAEALLAAMVVDDIDCLILDVHLPGRSGLELQGELQSADANLPIIFVSAYEEHRVQKQALDCGAVAFLPKPLDSQRLLDVIQQVVGDSC